MNRAYTLVWSRISNSWVVASELAKGGKKSSGKALKLAVLLAGSLTAAMASAAPAANALPSGESLAAGSATFDRSVANQLTVNQSSSKLISNWNSFDIGSTATVNFVQPDAASIALNRVTTGSPTQIFGQLNANGQLFIVNPNGLTFGAGSQVSAAAVVASSLDILDSDFNAGNYLFNRGLTAAAVVNHGSINAQYISLFAPDINNTGNLSANGGVVALFNANQADAGNLLVTQASTVAGVIKNSGNIQATQLAGSNGLLLLEGDSSQAGSSVQLSGNISADIAASVTGKNIEITGALTLNADSTLTAGDSIYIRNDLSMGNDRALNLNHGSDGGEGYFLDAGRQVNLNGSSAAFSVNTVAYTVIRDINQLQAINTDVKSLLVNYVLAQDIDATDTLNWNAGSGFVPIGLNGEPGFSGTLEGLGHQVNNLYINRPAVNGVGLIGYLRNGNVRNTGLVGHHISGGLATGALLGFYYTSEANSSISNSYAFGDVSGDSHVGGLIGALGSNSGILTIQNSYAGGNVTGTGRFIGGLIGSVNPNGSTTLVQNSYASSTVSGSQYVGGLVGRIVGSPRGVSSLVNSYATGNVSATSEAGGLVGAQHAGFMTSLSIQNSYASGQVSANTAAGGLVGELTGTVDSPSSVSNSYWDTQSSGQVLAVGSNSGGLLGQLNGLDSTQMKNLASFASWGSDIDAQAGTGSIWRIYEGHSTPLLRSLLQPLTISINSQTASKTYDGTTSTLSYNLSDVLADSSKIIDTFAARNVGSYAFGSSLYSTQDGYDIQIVNDGSLTINKRLLTIAASAAEKVYDGRAASDDRPWLTGRVSGDSIAGLRQSYSDKNAGTGKTVTVDAGYVIRDGNGGNNYDVLVLDNHHGVITPKALTISTVANSKVYDGGVTSANKPLLEGLLRGDRVTGLFQQYEDKSVGENKRLIIKAGYLVQDGNGGGNYALTKQDSHNGVITAH